MIEVLIALNEKGFISNEDSTPIFHGDKAHEEWRSAYLKDRRVVLGKWMADYWKHVPGSMATFCLTNGPLPVLGTMPITLETLTNRSAIDGHNFVVCGGYRTFVSVLPFADVVTLAFVGKDSGREKILLPEFPLHNRKWFPEATEQGFWVFRGLDESLVDEKEGVSGHGAIELPFLNISQP